MNARLRPCAVISRRTTISELVVGVEDRFDRGEILAGADEVLSSPAAEQQPDGLDENRLAGAGFARQDVERRFEFDGHRFDDRDIPYGEIADHQGPHPWAGCADAAGNPILSWV